MQTPSEGAHISSESGPPRQAVDELLQEIRIVLPGTETLLGFQFAAFFTSDFSKLELPQRYMHLANMLLVALSTVLLIAPVSLHQFSQDGEVTEGFLRAARRLIFAAMVSLSAGFSGDIFVAADITLNNDLIAAFIAACAWVFILISWRIWVGCKRMASGIRSS